MSKIAINAYALDGKIPPGDRMWGDFNDKFQNMDLEPMEIANSIWTGHAYAGWHEGRRNLENFRLAQHIAVDMDTNDERSAIAVLSQHLLVRSYAAMIHTTPSHTEQTPRARIIFLLDEPIVSAEAWRAAAVFLMSQFDGADQVCKDASRFFYGSKNADIWMAPNVLPLAQLRHYYRRWLMTQPKRRPPTPVATTQREHSQNTVKTSPDQLVDTIISKAASGNRNQLGYWFACVLRDDGIPRGEAEQAMYKYQRAVEHMGGDPYTETEAMMTLRSAYKKGH